MEHLATDVLLLFRVTALAAFGALALVAAARAPRSGAGGWWAAGAFTALSLVLLQGLVPDDVELPVLLRTTQILLLLTFPYLLLRFTGSFRRLPHWLEIPAGLAAVAALLSTALLPPLPEEPPLPSWAVVYVTAVLAYWVFVSSVTVVRLWTAGRGQPTVARRRMRLMGVATAALAVALLLAGAGLGAQALMLDVAVQAAILASAVAFGLGFSPPRAVRMSWSQPERERLQNATMDVLKATSIDDLARALLPPTAAIVGGAGAALVDPAGTVAASYGSAPRVGTNLPQGEPTDPGVVPLQIVPLGDDRGHLVVWTSTYTRFFGLEELGLLTTMAAVAGLALQRSSLLAEEREQRLVLERTQQEAEHARQEATQANLAKSEFLSRMSHEFRTPLNAILGFGQLLELSELSDEDEEAVGHIVKAGRHLLALVNDVLDLSRIEAGAMTISLEPVHTGELLDDATALIRPLADARSITLVVRPENCDAYIRTDRQRCRQILLNLLSNAVKYNHDGGEVQVLCERRGSDQLRVSVRDSGPGIDPARQQRLFEPFERLGAEGSGIEGTGLGLALTKQLVHAMGGEIGVTSATGEGSTFWIDLPLTEQPAETPQADPPSAPAVSGRRTLLLVEDNLTNLRLVEAMLRRRPEISVLPAMLGQLALDLASEHRPDIVVLDLHLPDLSGREVLNRLQSDPRTRHIPVVVASADASPGRVRQLREEGAFDYVTKPLDVHRFLEVVDAALEQSERA
jgi:signal transduction histidine kinase/ActR/RegA family two-component response regulator